MSISRFLNKSDGDFVLDQQRVEAAKHNVSEGVLAGQLTASSEPIIGKWLTRPAYAEYREAVLTLIEEKKFSELDRLFWTDIPFGTGGRRGEMSEFGAATINARTIAESAWGLATYAKRTNGEHGRKVVIACDTRLRSIEFSKLSARVCAAQGLKVYLFDGPRATPELSFAVRHLGCDCGIMISASHNPPADNGFKAYWSTGCQVLPPHDKGIIECVYTAEEIPAVSFEEGVATGQIEVIGPQVDAAYIQAVSQISLSTKRDVKALYTPLHGVGETSVYRVLHELGFDGVEIFEGQRAADGRFPNVPDQLPNPERPKVFEPAIPAAKGMGAALIMATDPDADRLAVMVQNKEGEYQFLTGNQLGALLVDHVLRSRQQIGKLSPQHYVVETLVTTPLIAAIAKQYGVRCIDQLLVGFKYIGATIDAEGPEGFLFGSEESLGYLAGSYARDKDACVGAVYVMELAAELAAAGQTLLDRLNEIFSQYGVYVEQQISRTCTGPTGQQQISAIMQAFRSKPPAAWGAARLVHVVDYQLHEARSLPDNATLRSVPEPKGDLLFVDAVAGPCELRVAMRPSGTEPKIKFYLFGKAPAGQAIEAATAQVEGALADLSAGLERWIAGVVA